MTINLQAPNIRELKPHITVFGCGGAGGNAVNNMVEGGLVGCDFVVANTDAQALALSKVERRIQMGLEVTQGLGAGAQPEVGRAAAEEVIDEIRDQLAGAHMVFITAGMGGGTGTGAAPVVARAARDLGILTVGVVTKPFHFEGSRRMRIADAGINELQRHVDTLIVIPNQNLFRVANEKTTFAEAFALADQVLYSGVASVTDLMVKEGLINLDFADVRSVMREMGKAMMGTGEATGEGRALASAEAAISNPLLDETSMKGARGLLISISGGRDLTLYEIDEAANRIRQEVDEDANVIFGATRDDSLEGVIRVSVVATGIDKPIESQADQEASERRIAEVAERIATEARNRNSEARQPPRRAPAPVAAPIAPVYVAPQPTYVSPQPMYASPPVQPAAMDYDFPAIPVEAPPQIVAEPDPVEEEAFIPPRAEPVVRAPRMPRLDELPPQAQPAIAAQSVQVAAPSPAEKRMTLLQRLAAVGLVRKEEGETTAPAPAPQPAAPTQTHTEYARRAPPSQPVRQGRLDQHGRPQASMRTAEEEQLEIPAFLRRQANS